MKLFSVLALLGCGVGAATNPQLGKVQSVYILPMANGMDQFLANRLTSLGVFQVVADPQKADTLLTDGVGEAFESKMKELYPPPPVVKKAEETDKDKDKDADKDKDKDSKDTKTESVKSTSKPFESAPMQSSWGRGRGNFFLVDRQTKGVIWSTYERPKNTTPDELSKTATRVVQSLKKDLEPPKEARNQ